MPYRTLLILGRLGILSLICLYFYPSSGHACRRPFTSSPWSYWFGRLTHDWLTLVQWRLDFVPSVARDVMTGPVTVFVFVCLVLFCFWLLETITRFLSIVFVILLLHDVLIGLSQCMHFPLWTYACVLWCAILLTWGVFLLAYCDLEVWPIMGDIEPICLGLEIWPREFEIVTYLLMIRAVPRSLPTPCFCFDLHPSIMSFTQHHPWDRYMTFPSSAFLPFHIPFLIRPGRVWGVWA